MRIDHIKRKLSFKLNKFFKDSGYNSDEYLDLYRIEDSSNTSKQYTDITIYAEITLDEFMSIQDILNSVIEKFDPASYFDIVEPGVFEARVYWNDKSAEYPQESVLTSKNLIKFGENICYDLEDEFNDVFYVDDITYDKTNQKLTLEVSSTDQEASASIKIYEYDVESYQELVDNFAGKLFNRLQTAMHEI